MWASDAGMTWPEKGLVKDARFDFLDEEDFPLHGGLHGLIWGEGNPSHVINFEDGARWVVTRVYTGKKNFVTLCGGKCRFARGEVVHTGTQESATRYIYTHGGRGHAITGANVRLSIKELQEIVDHCEGMVSSIRRKEGSKQDDATNAT